MSDAYGYWRAKLKGEDADMLPIFGGERASGEEPQPGIWKVKARKGGPLVPMRVWLTDDAGETKHQWSPGLQLAGTIGGNVSTLAELERAWAHRKDANSAASKADLAHYDEHGVWPGEIGHNSGAATPLEELADAVDVATTWLSKTAIADKTAADMAANHRTKLQGLIKRVDAEREVEKALHMQAAKAVDAKFKPKIDAGTDAANALRDALTKWMREEETKARAEADRKHRDAMAAAEAERKRIAEEQAAKMAADPIAALTDPAPELPPIPIAPEPIKVQAGGQAGRKTGFRTVTKYVVTDYAKALAAVKDHPDVQAVVQKVAAAMAKAGAKVEGVEEVKEKVAA